MNCHSLLASSPFLQFYMRSRPQWWAVGTHPAKAFVLQYLRWSRWLMSHFFVHTEQMNIRWIFTLMLNRNRINHKFPNYATSGYWPRLIFQGDAGGPLMCKQDGFWFQAAVLMVSTNSTNSTSRSRTSIMTFDTLSRFNDFLTQTLGTFLSPTSNGGFQSQSLLSVFHLLIFSMCPFFL